MAVTGRLGDIVYGVACAVAILWLAMAVLAGETHVVSNWMLDGTVGIGGALLIWIFGRAIRSVLAGR
jgi:hypothetical protein